MNLKDFDYYLPEELIADVPIERGESRLMILDRKAKTIKHSSFSEIVNFVDSNTTVVFNASKVIPARLYGSKITGGCVEILLVKEIMPNIWEAMAKSSKPLKIGEKIFFPEDATVEITDKKENIFIVKFEIKEGTIFEFLEKYGDVPLPPYILKKRGEKKSRPEDKIRYQTVYAKKPGSVAAPTAGLHFTDKIIENISKKNGGRIEFVFLDVGLGTFVPVKTENIKEHKMHKESFYIPEDTAERLNKDKELNRKILAVGTTTVRTLETAAENGKIKAGKNESEIFIYPGYEFKFTDSIVTNFHLPCSTLLMMISAFAEHDFIMEAYREAVKERYRFFSYGDAMLII